MSGIKAKISETMDKLTHKSGTNANTGTTGHTHTGTGTGTTGSGYGTSGTTGTTGSTGYDNTSTTGMGTTGTGMGTTSGTGIGSTDGAGYTTTGATDYGTTGTTGGGMQTGQVIDSETFTKTEDHERLIEKKRYELEHHPVEKKYVVETKYVGEQNVPGAPTEVVGNETNVVDERIKQALAGDRTVVVENVDVPASELRGTTGTGMGTGTGSTY